MDACFNVKIVTFDDLTGCTIDKNNKYPVEHNIYLLYRPNSYMIRFFY